MKKLLTVTALLLSSYLLTAQNNLVESNSNEPSKIIVTEPSPWDSNEYGIYYTGSILAKSNSEKVTASNNVGIGISSPSYKLHVVGDIYANGGWLRAYGSKGLLFQSYGGGLYMTDATWIKTYGNKSFYHNTGTMRTDGTFQVGPDGDRFIVNTSGNVGVGTTNPISNLDITSPTTPIVYIQSSALSAQDAILNIRGSRTTSTTADIGKIIFGSNDAVGGDLANITARKQTASTNEGNLLFWTTTTNGNAPTEKMRLTSNGNVGIGISTPTKKLDVSGDINYTGDLYKNGQLVDFSGGSSVWETNGTDIYYNSGNVGIGITDPGVAKLRVAGQFIVNGYSTGDMVDIVNDQANLPAGSDLIWGAYGWNTSQPNNPRLLHLSNTGSPRFVVRNNGQVGVNCDPGNSTYKLTVNGAILCEKVKCISDVPFADYVFDEDYQLLSINKLDEFVKEYKHLPEIPTAQDVKEEGIDVIELEVLLLKKVEELSLYTIQLYKKIAELEAQIKTTE